MTDYRVWPATNGPDTSGSDGTPINLGMEWYVTTAAWSTHARWYRGTANVQPDNVRLYRIDAPGVYTVVAEIASPTWSGTGWQEPAWPTPVPLTALQAYEVVVHYPDHYTATGGYWTASGPGAGGITNGVLVAPDTVQASTGSQGAYGYGAPAFPTGTFNGGNYWVDVVVTDTDPAAGGPVDLDGTAQAAGDATGLLTVSRSFSGSTPGSDDAGGDLGATRDVTGAANSATSAVGTASVTRSLTASVSAAASATATLTTASTEEPPEPPDEVFSLGTLTTGWSLGTASTGWFTGRVE